MVQVVWRKYMETMHHATFDDQTDLYVASGLLTYGASDGQLLVDSCAAALTASPLFHRNVHPPHTDRGDPCWKKVDACQVAKKST